MASKTLPDGRKVLVGSKADPDSTSYVPRATSSLPSTYDTLEQVKTRATELMTPSPATPERTPRYTSTPSSNAAPSSARIYDNDGSYSYAAPAPKSAEQIQKEMMRSAQGEVNALRDYENTLLDEQRVINEKNDRSTSSINTLTGLAGSTEANIQQQKTTEAGQKANQKIQAEVAVKIQSLLGNIRTSAVNEARAQREEARLDEETRLKNRAARQEEATSQLTNLAASGVTYDGMKQADPQGFAYLAKQFGGEDALKGAFVLNTPQSAILDKKLVGSTYVISKQNPLTGKVTVETVDIPGLPPDYSSSVDLGDRIMFFDPSDPQGKQFFMSKGMTPSQAASSAGDGYGGYNDDQNKVITRVDDKVSKNDTYKKTNNMRSYVDNVNTSLSQNTGTGDLAAINQFQKVIDEGAVTRDQDVKLIQSSQSLVNRLKSYEKKLSKGEQLSPELRTEMRTAANAMYEAQVKALSKDPFIESKKSELERYGIDPNDTIIGELGAFSAGGDLRSQVDAAGYDYDAMKADNLSDEEIQAAIQ